MTEKDYFQKVDEAAQFLRKKNSVRPELVIILSGGLRSFVDLLEKTTTFHCTDIPHFPHARAEGHSGEIIFGKYQGISLAVLQGRSHFYEGLTPQEVVFPYFVLHSLGAKILITTNAVGGIRANLHAGDLMLVKDHINFMGTNPLIGVDVQQKTEQFTSMQEAYDPALRKLAKQVAKKIKLPMKEGVYLGTPGPSYETPAEIHAFRKLGADTVGMSTVFEVLAARFLGLRVLTLNIVANASADRHNGTMSHQEVLNAVKKVQPKVIDWLCKMVVEVGKL